MAEKKQHLLWILAELPQLQEQGILPPETGERLREHYRKKLDEAAALPKIFSLIVGVIGLLMVAAGIVLFVNHNWDMLDKPARIALAAVPLLIGAAVSYFTIAANRWQLWREASALLTATGAATLIALLSQIYQMYGEFSDYMFLVLLLSLPLIYLFNSITLAALYVFFAFSMLEGDGFWRPFLMGGLMIPYLCWHLRQNDPWQTACRYLLMPAALLMALAVCRSGGHWWWLLAPALCSPFIKAGLGLKFNGVGGIRNPWLIAAFLFQLVLVVIASFDEGPGQVFAGSNPLRIGSAENVPQAVAFWVFFAGCMVWDFACMRRDPQELLLQSLPLIPVVLVLGDCVGEIFTGHGGIVPPSGFSIYMLIAGGICLYRGWCRRSMLIFDGGAVLLLVLGICRFFDSEIGILYRSLGFVCLGLIFCAANMVFARRKKQGGRA